MNIKDLFTKRHGQLILVVVIAAILPLFIKNDSIRHIGILMLLYVILALGLEVALGITGLFSLCHAAFYGMGAYVSALLSLRLGWSFWITMPLGAISAGILGLLIGLPALRTSGDYLAIATLGMGEIFRLALINGGKFTRGPSGLPGIARPHLFGISFLNKATYYYLLLIVAVIVYLVVLHIPRTFFGRALMAVRDDEAAAGFMGINVSRYRIAAFAISGLIAGIAGAFYAHYICFISPDTFVYNDSITILTMVLIGGTGTVVGPVLGAILLTILPEFLRSFVQYRMLIYGIIVVLMMQFMPNGVLGKVNTRNSYLRSLLKDKGSLGDNERKEV